MSNKKITLNEKPLINCLYCRWFDFHIDQNDHESGINCLQHAFVLSDNYLVTEDLRNVLEENQDCKSFEVEEND